ncbi:MAG: penicillin-binding protein activator [gamma proteobacterium symbiont of Lucinoma myriamae]|nr:penicillin-binding protein activator [gamma proteobacterium symbiont of Lucinoma myriamae]
MSKLYQYTSLFIIILFVTGCGGSLTVKDGTKTSSGSEPHIFNAAVISAMNTDERINTAEKLFESAQLQIKDSSEQNQLLSNALLVCTQILIDSHQATIVRDQSLSKISQEEYDYTLQLTRKITAQINTTTLSSEQRNQYILMSALISLTNYQPEKTLIQLNQDFNSGLAELWSIYHQLRAMAQFQLDQQEKAVKELIIRHGYLSLEAEKQNNQKLIWNYLAGLNIENISITSSSNDGDRIYSGWLELARILRDSRDPQTLNHDVNFWLQSHPAHQADRAFINNIIQTRQASVLNLKQVAVLLPLQGKLAKPAKAVLDGIIASHYNSPLSTHLQLRFYDTSDDQTISISYQEALDDGADFVIGPLAKSNLEALSELNIVDIPVLALNSLENKQNPTPEKLFQFGLSPESAARMVAEKARKDGHYYAAVMAPDSAWGKRMNKAFSSHWQKLGGAIADHIAYQSQSHDFSDSIKSMFNIDQSESRSKEVSRTIGRKLKFTPRRRQDIDMLFMAALPRQAKQIPLQIIYHHGETIPIYSTSHIVANYHNARQNIDMDGVNFTDMPFLLGITDNTTSQQNAYQSTLYQRLFAMGVDSYQLAPFINYLYKNPSESFNGDTGTITINNHGHIIRALPWATFEQGNIKLINKEINQDNASLY